jgi:hypothetical protein
MPGMAGCMQQPLSQQQQQQTQQLPLRLRHTVYIGTARSPLLCLPACHACLQYHPDKNPDPKATQYFATHIAKVRQQQQPAAAAAMAGSSLQHSLLNADCSPARLQLALPCAELSCLSCRAISLQLGVHPSAMHTQPACPAGLPTCLSCLPAIAPNPSHAGLQGAD